MMERIDRKSFWLFMPALAEVFVGRKASKRFGSLGEVVSLLEGLEMCFQMLMGLLIAFLHRGFLEGAVHGLELAVNPGITDLGKPVLHPMLMADAIEDMDEGQSVALALRKLAAGIGQHCMGMVGYGGDKVTKESGGNHLVVFRAARHRRTCRRGRCRRTGIGCLVPCVPRWC
jgi:hypothetical protein